MDTDLIPRVAGAYGIRPPGHRVAQSVVDIVFLARYLSGTPAPGDPAEIASLAWITAGKIMAHPRCASWTRDSIRIAEQRRQFLDWD